MANPKSFAKAVLFNKIKIGDKKGLQRLRIDGKYDVDFSKYNYNELRSVLTILNNEANRRLVTVSKEIQKSLDKGKTINQILGNQVADIYEFNPATGGRIAIDNNKTKVRAFKQWSGITKEEIIRQIRDRQSFLNKESSTLTGFRNQKTRQRQTFQKFIGDELTRVLGHNPTKEEVKKFSKMLDMFKNDKFIFRDKSLNPTVGGTNDILQEAFQIIDDNGLKNIDIDYVINKAEYKAYAKKYEDIYKKNVFYYQMDAKVYGWGEEELKNQLDMLKESYQSQIGELKKRYAQ